MTLKRAYGPIFGVKNGLIIYLQETEESYGPVFGVKDEAIASKNALLWDVIPVRTVS